MDARNAEPRDQILDGRGLEKWPLQKQIGHPIGSFSAIGKIIPCCWIAFRGRAGRRRPNPRLTCAMQGRLGMRLEASVL